MMELDRNDLLEETEYDGIGLDDDGPDGSESFPRLTRENYVDRVRFARVPADGAAAVKPEDLASSADPLYIYYRSMSKIPLLTREQEVYLAKKIESAKINTLRLLSLTPINTFRVMELADELQPAEPRHRLGDVDEQRVRDGVAAVAQQDVDDLLGVVAGGAGVPEPERGEAIGVDVLRRALELGERRDRAAARVGVGVVDLEQQRLVALDDERARHGVTSTIRCTATVSSASRSRSSTRTRPASTRSALPGWSSPACASAACCIFAACCVQSA